ncbi:hypothetical protein ACFV80_16805 [Streptomyces sp. NPDC059862]|uniref:hypothetical protein n=1 Tax=Streptomyces sp. NPDC059862 TaxID=3346975 RepID=UPI0036633E7A
MTGTHNPQEEVRARLATAQARLLAALLTGAPAPAGFDAARLAVQTATLVAKRRDGVHRVRPDLNEALGPRFRALFDAYATAYPKPAHGGSRVDAQAFVQHLAAQGLLPQPQARPSRPRTLLRRLAHRLIFRR